MTVCLNQLVLWALVNLRPQAQNVALPLRLRRGRYSDAMSQTSAPRRFRFSLRAALALTAIVAALVGLAVYPLTWIRAREAWRAPTSGAMFGTMSADAPWLLAMYGEQGESWIELKKATNEQLAEVQRLFPEATVVRHELQPVVIPSAPALMAPFAPAAPASAPAYIKPPVPQAANNPADAGMRSALHWLACSARRRRTICRRPTPHVDMEGLILRRSSLPATLVLAPICLAASNAPHNERGLFTSLSKTLSHPCGD
jgi:hypothetical protein